MGLFENSKFGSCRILFRYLWRCFDGKGHELVLQEQDESAYRFGRRFCGTYGSTSISKVGQEEVPDNYLLMHAMGPNVAGVIGSAVAAGVLLSLFL